MDALHGCSNAWWWHDERLEAWDCQAWRLYVIVWWHLRICTPRLVFVGLIWGVTGGGYGTTVWYADLPGPVGFCRFILGLRNKLIRRANMLPMDAHMLGWQWRMYLYDWDGTISGKWCLQKSCGLELAYTYHVHGSHMRKVYNQNLNGA